MADGFSVATGVLTVGDVCIKVSKCLHEIVVTVKHLDATIHGLNEEIEGFKKVNDALGQICDSEAKKRAAERQCGAQDPCAKLYDRANAIVAEGQGLVEGLDDKLQKVLAKDSKTPWKSLDKILQAAALTHEQEYFASTRRRLGTLNSELAAMIAGIELVSNASFRLDVYRSFDQLPQKIAEELQVAILQFKAHINKLESSGDAPEESILTAKSAMSYASLNRHFYVQTPDTGIWTGRAAHLEQLRCALLTSSVVAERRQKRFVIHGIAGAGKTQVCSKFAQDFRQSFWGIFWVDATTPQSASASWRDIAKLGGKEPHENAGKNWLSNLQSPWLLIIDSATESEDAVQSNFPSGDRGCVIITTRNPRLAISATVGSMSLGKLSEGEANDLLQKATRHNPWDASAKEAASSIAQRLGYLALALVHAGRAIHHQMSTLHGYIPWFDNVLSDFRRERMSRVIEEDEILGRSALSSFEVIYAGLEAQALKAGARAQVYLDAIELGNIFAFLHCNDIRLETFIRAGRNLQHIRDEAATKTQVVIEEDIRRSTWYRLKEWAIAWGMKFWSEDPALPQIFRSIKTFSFSEQRLRRAIDLLVRYAMISESSDLGCYSIHPLVHDWLRSRLSLAEQALWCQTAGNILASSIKLPPLADEPNDRHYYIRMLSHVRHVQLIRDQLSQGIQSNKEGIWRQRLTALLRTRKVAGFSAIDAGNFARYSRVFMESGQYADAERLQICVSDFLRAKLGTSHQLSIRIQLALSSTLAHQGRTSEAINLQRGALAVSITTAGSNHPQTLRIMDGLGETQWMCGFFKEAKQMLENAVAGMSSRSDMDREKFRAMDHLGRVHTKYLDFDTARQLHEVAVDGLTSCLGADDPDTWVAMDNLAMVLVYIGERSGIIRAHELMESVYAGRVSRFGPEHYYTLWAADNLARAMAMRGESEGRPDLIVEAKTLGQNALAAALYNENLGPMHIGVLAGRTHLANIDVSQGNFVEAEAELRTVMQLQKELVSARNGTHPDRIGTMEVLLRCMEIQNRIQDAIVVCDSMIEEMSWLGGDVHPLRKKILDKRERLSRTSDISQEMANH